MPMMTTAKLTKEAVKAVHNSASTSIIRLQRPQLLQTCGNRPTIAIVAWNLLSIRQCASERRSKSVELPQPTPGYRIRGREEKRFQRPDVEENTKAFPQPDSTSTLHLLRALLRQVTYLPDPASRKYFHTHIRSRFRDYCPRRSTPTPGSTGKEESIEKAGLEAKALSKRRTRMLAQARQELVFFKKANAGCANSLQKVLELTYGRRGRRKHELLRDLRIPKPSPMDTKDLAKFMEALESEGTSAPKLPLFSDKLIALVKSQMKQKHALFSKPVPKSSAPQVPETNLWLRPLPVVRIKNITEKWYAETLERLMPPLPEAEWKHLEALAIGNIEWTRRPQRMKGTGPWGDEAESVGGPKDSITRQSHELTPRYMRRMWASVFAQCPLMRWSSDRLRWDVQWGRVDKAKGLALSTNKPLDDTAFEGVDAAGRILGAKS